MEEKDGDRQREREKDAGMDREKGREVDRQRERVIGRRSKPLFDFAASPIRSVNFSSVKPSRPWVVFWTDISKCSEGEEGQILFL